MVREISGKMLTRPGRLRARSGSMRLRQVPLRAHRERLDAKVRVPGIVFGCFAESVPKSLFRELGTKREPKRAKRKPKGSKREPKGAKREAKGAKREPKWSQGATKMHIKIDLRKGFEKVVKRQRS